MKPVLADTGFLVAVYDKRERHNQTCMRLYEALDNQLVTCEPVITETLHLLRFASGASDDILASVEEGILQIPFRLSESASSVRKILRKYRDLEVDIADACLVQMADELDTGDILTLDSGFRHYRWRRNRAFRLLIPLE